MASLQKNVASQNFTFALINVSSGAGWTGTAGTVTVNVTKDGGSQASGGGTVTAQGSGQFNYAPTQAETNATDVGFLFTATGVIPFNADFHTDQVDSNGFVKVDVVDIAGSTVSTSSAQLGVNVVNIAGQAASLDANNLLKVDVADWNGTVVSSPATAGIPDVNAKNINNVATTSVTTINANQGTTQPVNFTGTGSSAFVKSDMQDIAGSAVSTSSAQIGVNLVNISGSGVSTSSAQLGVNTVNIAGQAAALDANNLLKVDVEDINGNATAAQNVSKANQAICRGTCTTGGSTTSIPTSAFVPNASGIVSGQFIGRTIVFDINTTTTSLQGQATNITANTSGATPTFTVGALTTSPSSGDTFGVY